MTTMDFQTIYIGWEIVVVVIRQSGECELTLPVETLAL